MEPSQQWLGSPAFRVPYSVTLPLLLTGECIFWLAGSGDTRHLSKTSFRTQSCATDFVTLTVTFSVFLTPFLPDLRSFGRSTAGEEKIFLPSFLS
jgi:hypothetical protein